VAPASSTCSITSWLPVATANIPFDWLSTINVQGPAAADTNLPDAVVTSSADKGEGAGVLLLTVPRHQFLTVDNMKHAVSIETLASNENDS